MGSPEAAHNSDWLAQVKELAAGVSVQTQVANRVWLALMTVALVAELPHGADKGPGLSLPFGLGNVSSTYFYPVAFFILVVLAVAFAAAHAQVVRAGVLAQKMLDSLCKVHSGGVDPREMFDMARTPSLNRVAPLAQLAMDQFSATRWWVRILGILYYVVLKLPSVFVYYGLPVWAVWQAYANASRSGMPSIAIVAEGAALFALFHVFVSDILYSRKVVLRLWGSGSP